MTLGKKEKLHMTEKTYSVAGMTCQHCVNAVTSEVSGIDGVKSAAVDLTDGTVTVTGEGYTDEQIRAAVDEAGYSLADA
jgi:copper chaperone CopZ